MAVLNKRAIVTAIEMYGVTAIRLGRTINPALDVLIKALFTAGEQGFAYDPNDLSTLYQDVAGTTPVTAAGQPVGLMLDKSKGLVLGSEFLTNNWNLSGQVDWSYSNGVLTKSGITAGGGPLQLNTSPFFAGSLYRVEYEIISVGNGGLVAIQFQGGTSKATQYRGVVGKYVEYLFAASGNEYLRVIANGASTVFSMKVISVKELTGNHAYQTVSASRPILQRNATTGAYYLAFDGADDFLQTNSIDFTVTDKVSLFAGVRKLSTVSGMVIELSSSLSTNNGSFYLAAPAGQAVPNQIIFASKGTIFSSAQNTNLPPPISVVISCKGNIAADSTIIRTNGTQFSSAEDLGTGNYGNHPLYIGRRGGTSLPFNGHIYGLIGIGRLTTDSETIALEKFIAKNTGVTLNV